MVICHICKNEIYTKNLNTISNLYCGHSVHIHCLHFGTTPTTNDCQNETCFNRIWWMTKKEADDQKDELTEMEEELCRSFENIGPLQIQLKQYNYFMEQVSGLVNQLELGPSSSLKQQKLLDWLKKIVSSSNKQQTLQELDNENSQKVLINFDGKNIANIKDGKTQQIVIGHPYSVRNQLNENEANIGDFENINDQLESTENIVIKQQKRMDEIKNEVKSLAKLIAQGEDNSKNLKEQQERLNRIEKTVEGLDKL